MKLIVKGDSNNNLALDVDCVTVNGRPFAMPADTEGFAKGGERGILGSQVTGDFIDGTATLGTVVTSVPASHSQIVTRGRNIQVPAESVLAFRLAQPLEERVDHTH